MMAWSQFVTTWGEFVADRLGELWTRTGEHLFLTGAATAMAVVIGVPLGIVCRRVRAVRGPVLGGVGILQAVPSLAMLAILLSLIGKIGAIPAIVALTLYALLPIVRNTVTGLEGVSDQVIEAARGVGMTRWQQLRMVRIPLALPVIVAGIRTAAVIGVGIATLSTYIGAGGLGQFINRGLSLDDPRLIVLGAVPAAALALLVDFSIWAAEWSVRPVRQTQRRRVVVALKPVAMAAPVVLVIFGVLTSAVEIGSPDVRPQARGKGRIGTPGTVRIGSKEFGEQLLLGELMAQVIEARTYLTAQRRFGLGGTEICHGALVRGQIDLYAEYTGTGYRSILKRKGEIAGPYTVFLQVHREYLERFLVEWLEPFGFYNSYAITVRRQDAEANGWKTVSDLAGVAGELRAGFTSEFQEREDGYPGLRKVYGFSFGEAVDMSADLMPQALAKREVDVICAFTTDGRLSAYQLAPLRDDKGFWPPYDAAPVVRVAFLKEHPEVRHALSLLAGLLDNETMRGLNYEVQVEKRSRAEVAREFLKARELIE
jgi:osmoprotectant transport system permease protein